MAECMEGTKGRLQQKGKETECATYGKRCKGIHNLFRKKMYTSTYMHTYIHAICAVLYTSSMSYLHLLMYDSLVLFYLTITKTKSAHFRTKCILQLEMKAIRKSRALITKNNCEIVV